jgi:predicted DNA-binding transcriptional regulator YafY
MPEKWDLAKPGEKLLSLYSLLMVSRRSLSLTELSLKLNCSKQAVLRLIEQLENVRFGQIISEKRGREAVFRLDRPKEMPQLTFTPFDLRELAMCRNFLGHVLPGSMKKHIDATLRQAAAFVPEGIDINLSDRLGRSMFKGRIDYSPFAEMLETLIKAISENRLCLVGYQASWQGPGKEFDFAPKQLAVFHEAMYLEGWLVSSTGQALYEAPANLAVHRLKTVTLLEGDSSSLPDIPADHSRFGLIKDEPFEVKVKFSPSAAAYVAEREWSTPERKTIHSDGGLTLILNAFNQYEIISWLLSFGQEAQVLSPKWLREAIIDNITQSLANYKPAVDNSGQKSE